MLQRFLVRFDRDELYRPVQQAKLEDLRARLGVVPAHLDTKGRALPPTIGVTGYDLDDALSLIKRFHWADDLPPIAELIPTPDVGELLATGALGPIGVPVWRGIWYPPWNLAGHECDVS
jgi:hypothetical protein